MRHSARTFASLLLLAPLASVAGAVAQQPDLAWQLQDSGVEVPLRGLSAVSDRVAWARDR